MGEYKRFTGEETAAVWEGWRRGQSLTTIAGALNRRACSVLLVIRREGGFAPRRRLRSERCLRMGEREDISRGLAAGRSVRAIARALGRAPSTVSREIKRNGGRDRYRANQADEHAWGRARRPQRCLLAQLADCNAGRAALSLRDAYQGRQQGDSGRDQGSGKDHPPTAHTIAPLVDLGPWQRNEGPPRLHRGHGRTSLAAMKIPMGC